MKSTRTKQIEMPCVHNPRHNMRYIGVRERNDRDYHTWYCDHCKIKQLYPIFPEYNQTEKWMK
jgi:hypothetical protein